MERGKEREGEGGGGGEGEGGGEGDEGLHVTTQQCQSCREDPGYSVAPEEEESMEDSEDSSVQRYSKRHSATTNNIESIHTYRRPWCSSSFISSTTSTTLGERESLSMTRGDEHDGRLWSTLTTASSKSTSHTLHQRA